MNKDTLFSDHSEVARRIREFDWSKTSLGPVEQWPVSLVSTLSICLSAHFPMAIYWGREGCLIYNDAWRPILGDKHSWALGRPAHEVWPEIWDVIAPLFESVLTTGEATWRSDALLPMQRFGYTEECYFDYTFNPIRGQSGKVEGILNVVQETTYRVLNERRTRLLRELASRCSSAKTEKASCEAAIAAMATDTADIPFALLYLIENNNRKARLLNTMGLPMDSPARLEAIGLTAETVDRGWPLNAAIRAGPIALDDLPQRFGALPGGLWPEPTTQALVLPIAPAGQEAISVMLVAGVNPRHALDSDYRLFFENVAAHIATAITNARAYEEERKRLEALAQIDRAKTAFFSNVSHEFRTPLSLILGPAEELLSGTLGDTNEIQRAHLATLRHNAVRLQKLVNTLLDYARVEAGRVEGTYEPVDIGLLTRELASSFCSAVHRARLLYIVNCPSIDEPVYVDRDMWEKIVLNLLSNALKFTFEGAIEVSLKLVDDGVTFAVRDTGVGIPDEEQPRLFDRFHRVHGGRARTHEGSGIGLALVQELVKLNGGSLHVESAVGVGTTFTIFIPKGSAHLPKERLSAPRASSSTALGAAPFVEEALRWLPHGDQLEMLSLPVGASPLIDACRSISPSAERILVADDNLDMRNYLTRLLEMHWNVTAVEDGASALEVARTQHPDLVLGDVMMPGLDGFELLRKLREDNRTSTIPVILLSARAGEESYIEGMKAGADDYIVKPFGARELVARVKALLEVTRVRRESERRVTNILESITDGFHVIDSDWRLTYVNAEAKRTLLEHGVDPDWAIGKHFWEELFPAAAESDMATQLRRAMTERVSVAVETYYPPWNRWYYNRAYPLPEGGLANYFQDITVRKEAEKANARLAAIVESSGDAIISKDLDGIITSWNQAAERLFGYTAEEAIRQPITLIIPPDRLDEEPVILNRVRHGERIEHYETVRRRKDGKLLHISLSVSPIVDPKGRIVGASKIARDISERKVAEQKLRQSEERFRTMADSSPIMIWMTDANGGPSFLNRAYLDYVGISADDAATFDWAEIVHSDDRDAYVAAFETALQKRQTFHQRARLRRHDGEWRWFESRGNPIVDDAGNLIAFIGSLPDITEMYESQRVLKELDQRKDEFLANMSHEIRSPLTGIMGYADILLSRLKDPDDIECLKTIKESGDYLIEIVNDILDLSKIEAGKLVMTLEAVSVHSVLAEVQSLMDVRAKQKKLPLSLRYEGALPVSIQTDRTRLRQILINLVSNAIKFTDRGRVEILARSVDGLLQIEVIDTGIGIAPEHQDLLFQPFTQADTTSTRQYGGTGLGLTITRRLVEMLGGSISFESELNRGSTFRVRIPAAGSVLGTPKSTDLRLPVNAPLDDIPLHNRHVLVVDDRREICYLVSRYVKDAGGRPDTATDGEAAIRAVEAAAAAGDPFHAMLLDVHMPGMDGYEVARMLRAKGFQMPIIAVTAGAMVGDRDKCLQAGCDDYLTKPIDRRKLVQVVARHAQKAGSSMDGSKLRVLLVDDSHSACELLRRFLAKRGHDVRSAHDGRSALPLAQQFRPDVVVLDIRLPDINGYELMRRLKETDGIGRAMFIAVSGYRDDQAPGQAAMEFDHFLEKPLDMTQLEALLGSIVN
jgi:PAS domain S-box-containing protein